MTDKADILARDRTITALQFRAWKASQDHGFHDEGVTFGDRIALIHSELSEALEDFRKFGSTAFVYRTEYSLESDTEKPEGVGAELADAVIRIFDAAEYYGIDLERIILEKMDYNDTRPYKHGGKFL